MIDSMKPKDEVINLMKFYKSENYSYGIRDRGEERPWFIRSLISHEKASDLYDLVLRYSKIEGDVAEIGVWRGGSAILLAELIQDKNIYLFDTFEGLPYNHPEDNFHVTEDFNDVDFDEVVQTLSEWKNISVHKGIFPQETSQHIEDKRFSIVHIDVDMYKAYLDCLEFFYDRMIRGGVILLDDYDEPTCKGATLATNQFFSDKPEKIQRLGFQYFVEKL